MPSKLKRFLFLTFFIFHFSFFIFFLISCKNNEIQQDISQSLPSSFINEKITTGTDINIYLPEKFDQETTTVKFEPEIEGNVHKSENKEILTFEPTNILEPGTFYAGIISNETNNLKTEFEIVNLPKVIAAFPNEN